MAFTDRPADQWDVIKRPELEAVMVSIVRPLGYAVVPSYCV